MTEHTASEQGGETRPPKPNRIVFRNIPPPLEGITDNRWCLWRWIWRDNKWTKPPLQAGGSFGDTSDPATWCSVETAQAALANGHDLDGIGLNLKDLKGIAVIDLDDCRDPETGTAKPVAKELILKAQSYAEATPSGTGFRIIGTVPKDFRDIGTQRKIDDFHIEIYANSVKGRYITVTGAHLSGVPNTLADISALIDELDERRSGTRGRGRRL
jgi:primase-polymerase (primpol)-like protein